MNFFKKLFDVKITKKDIIFYVVEVILLVVLILADLLSKSIVSEALDYTVGNSITVIEGFCNLTYIENYGASFGILEGQQWFLITISLILCIAGLVFLVIQPKAHRLLRFSIVVIIAGAFGNLYDRIAFGFVRDFIEYKFFETWFGINFGIGNVADLVIIFGFIMLIVYIIFVYGNNEKKNKVKDEANKKDSQNNNKESEKDAV